MMNEARLGVGLQGIALGERAYQQALGYARERKQGRDALTGEALVTIDRHPDIRRMLMLMKSRVEACRAMAYYTSGLLDRAHVITDAEEKKRNLYLAEFMIPIVKGGGTEMAIDVTSLGIQIYGGMGYLHLAVTVCGGWMMGKAALAAAGYLDKGEGDQAFCRAKIATALFYADQMLPQAAAYGETVRAGNTALAGVGDEVF